MAFIHHGNFRLGCFKVFASLICIAGGNIPAELCAGHGVHRVDEDSRLSGASLENQLWTLVQTRNTDQLKDLISPIFLGGNTVGIFNYDAELSGLTNIHIDSFTLNNIIESQSEDIRIIAYNFVATGQTPVNDLRVSVWQRVKHKHHQYFWVLISHSNFSPNL